MGHLTSCVACGAVLLISHSLSTHVMLASRVMPVVVISVVWLGCHTSFFIGQFLIYYIPIV